MSSSQRLQRWLSSIAAAIPLIILALAILSIPLAAAQEMGLSATTTSSWLFTLYALPGGLSVLLILKYRQPLVLTGNVFVLIFIASLGRQLQYDELIGSAMVAGLVIVLLGWLRLGERLANWIPVPVVMGILAGAVTPFVADIFTFLGQAPLLVGGMVVAYFLGHTVLGERMPALFPAIIVGLIIVLLSGELGSIASGITWSLPVIYRPSFSFQALVAATPVMLILIVLQANLPSLIFLQEQGYDAPQAAINATSGLATLLGSLLGPTGISLSLPATSLVGGKLAGELSLRYRAALIAAVAVIIVGLFGNVAAELPEVVPMSFLLTLAGLALINVLANALQQMVRAPRMTGSILAFAIVLSDITLLGLGPFFWALVIGTVVSQLVDRPNHNSS